MSVLRNSAACLLRKALRSFQHVAPVVREVQGNWRGCSNQSNGDNNAPTPSDLQRQKEAEESLGKFGPLIRVKKALFNEKDTDEDTDEDSSEDLSLEMEQLTVEEQLKRSKEVMTVMKKRLTKLKEENENLNYAVDVFVNHILNRRFANMLQSYKRKKD